jgi:hypothetical protein
LSRSYGCKPLILCLFAGFATFWLVFEPLIMEKDLLTGSPDEILTAIYAFDIAILEFHLGLAPFTVRSGNDLSL